MRSLFSLNWGCKTDFGVGFPLITRSLSRRRSNLNGLIVYKKLTLCKKRSRCYITGATKVKKINEREKEGRKVKTKFSRGPRLVLKAIPGAIGVLLTLLALTSHLELGNTRHDLLLLTLNSITLTLLSSAGKEPKLRFKEVPLYTSRKNLMEVALTAATSWLGLAWLMRNLHTPVAQKLLWGGEVQLLLIWIFACVFPLAELAGQKPPEGLKN